MKSIDLATSQNQIKDQIATKAEIHWPISHKLGLSIDGLLLIYMIRQMLCICDIGQLNEYAIMEFFVNKHMWHIWHMW